MQLESESKTGTDGDGLLDSLGVTTIDAAQVERSVLAKASQELKEGRPEQNDTSLPSQEDQFENEIKALGREIKAVRVAIEAIDEGIKKEAAERAVPKNETEPRESSVQQSPSSSAYPSLEKCLTSSLGKPDDKGLQRAGLAQRLTDLIAKRKECKAALADLHDQPHSPEKPKDEDAPGQLQEVDPFASSAPAGLVETERDRLIRLGILTPFDRLEGFERKQKEKPEARGNSDLNSLQTSEALANTGRPVDAPFQKVVGQLRSAEANRPRSKLVDPSELPRREKAVKRVEEAFWHQAASGHSNPIKKRRKQTLKRSAEKAAPMGKPRKRKRIRKAAGDSESSASEFEPSAESASDVSFESEADNESEDGEADVSGIYDDADLEQYNQRLHTYWLHKRRERQKQEEAGEEPLPDAEFDGGFKVPGSIFTRLFDYQKTGVKWLWELHTQRAGGIIGDEMGLGKTIQLAAFLAGLHHSGKFRASIIVSPATVLRQWLRELRAWYPSFRVAVLHDSQKSGMLSRPSKEQLVREISRDPSGILITSFEQLRLQRNLLMGIRWGYAILDEGHKIRNPDADVTLVAKQLQTVHRIIMTGSPIQNRLTELWSLFDFVFPGKLGTLPVFQTQFALPIQIGGYSNASAMQVSTAYKCAVVLRDLIAPYLLRRRKADVATQLPKKTEQVLFCSLTTAQRDLYRAFLSSKECEDILNDKKNALAGIDILRKLCNHPDLLQRSSWENSEEYGTVERSGKLIVAMKVLEHWLHQGHKALLFTQTQQMLDIIERSVQNAGMSYHRMDGSTAVAGRARLVDDFNDNPQVFVFLLTTKVGGVGINLTGANRVLVFDPDWNPSTDMQARERAWRIGQQKEVTVYRLITSGTIEEKVYHRQVYKQFLTNKVLRDPRQKRFFKAKDMSDLFQLGDQYAVAPETAQIFAGVNSEIPLIEAGQASQLTTPSMPPPVGEEIGGSNGMPQGLAGKGVLPGSVKEEDGRNDTQMLRDLFEGTGVMSALDHAKIEAANDPESLSVDAQAAKVAKRAADALRRSQAQVQAAPLNVPTWTGRHGQSGLDSNATTVRRFGGVANPGFRPGSLPAAPGSFAGTSAGVTGGTAPRSADLLAHLKQRQQNTAAAAARTSNASSSSPSHSSPEEAYAKKLAKDIVDFLSEIGGQGSSVLVLQHFSDRVGPTQASLFRHVLQSVAKLEKRQGVKSWTLRPEFAELAAGSNHSTG